MYFSEAITLLRIVICDVFRLNDSLMLVWLFINTYIKLQIFN